MLEYRMMMESCDILEKEKHPLSSQVVPLIMLLSDCFKMATLQKGISLLFNESAIDPEIENES